MNIELKNIKNQNILFFDIEFTDNSIVQIAGLIFSKEKENIFQLKESFNYYIKQNKMLDKYFIIYTNITDDFLMDNGCDFLFVKKNLEQILSKYNNDILFVSHGISSDFNILRKNNIELNGDKFCTYKKAKQILRKDNKLSLQDVSASCGYFLYNAHNAYADVVGTLFSFCYLNRMEE